MALRYSDKVRNAALDARIAAIGPSPMLHLRDASGEPLATLRLPKVWMSKAQDGMVQKVNDWAGSAHKPGRAASFCIAGSDGDHITGDIPGDMKIDNPNFEAGQNVSVGRFIIAAGNTSQAG